MTKSPDDLFNDERILSDKQCPECGQYLKSCGAIVGPYFCPSCLNKALEKLEQVLTQRKKQ